MTRAVPAMLTGLIVGVTVFTAFAIGRGVERQLHVDQFKATQEFRDFITELDRIHSDE